MPQFQILEKKEELIRAQKQLVIERAEWRRRLSELEGAVMSRLGGSSIRLEVIAR